MSQKGKLGNNYPLSKRRLLPKSRNDMRRTILLAGIIFTLVACSPQEQTLTVETPTVADCAPTLALDSTIFQIEVIEILPDGSLPEVGTKTGTVYWINGTDQILLFVLSPTPENLELISRLTDGSIATATWSNCTSFNYSLSAPVPGSFEITYLPDQTTSGIKIFILPDSSGKGFVINGEETGG
jgi:hypothetical protein